VTLLDGTTYHLIFSRVHTFYDPSLKLNNIFLQVLVIDYKLTYPSGTATAVLINGFHTPQGDKNERYRLLKPVSQPC
jgi:hypothetical protein